MDWGTVAAAGITAVCSLVGVYVANRKSAAVTDYRLKSLEDKVTAHNQIIERVYIAEGKITELQHDVSDLKGRAG